MMPSVESYSRLALQWANRGRRIADLELALDAALIVLGQQEPPDSRAMSDEFVSMAAISCDCPNDECREILRKFIAQHDDKLEPSS